MPFLLHAIFGMIYVFRRLFGVSIYNGFEHSFFSHFRRIWAVCNVTEFAGPSELRDIVKPVELLLVCRFCCMPFLG